MVNRRRRRGISEIIGTIIVVVAVLVGGLLVYQVMSKSAKTGNTVAIKAVASGEGSDDGTMGTLSITIQNTGDVAVGVTSIYVKGLGVAQVTSASTPIANISVAVGEPSNVGSLPSGVQYVVIPPKSSTVVTINLSGSNLYPGVKVKYSIVYYDMTTKKGNVESGIATLNP